MASWASLGLGTSMSSVALLRKDSLGVLCSWCFFLALLALVFAVFLASPMPQLCAANGSDVAASSNADNPASASGQEQPRDQEASVSTGSGKTSGKADAGTAQPQEGDDNAPVAIPEIRPGDPAQRLLAVMGKPTGEMSAGNVRMLTYPGGKVKVRDGKVVELEKGFNAKMQEHFQKLRMAERMRAKGLVLFDGEWVTPEEKQRLQQQEKVDSLSDRQKEAIRDLIDKSIADYNDGGQEIDLGKVFQQGKINVLCFYAHWHEPSQELVAQLEYIAMKDPWIFLSKVEVAQPDSPVVKQFQIRQIPHVIVFTLQGQGIGGPTGDIETILQYLMAAKENAAPVSPGRR